MQTVSINSVINQAESLNSEDQLLFFDLFQKRLNEIRRNEIAKNGEITIQAIKQKKANIGSVNDFLKEMAND